MNLKKSKMEKRNPVSNLENVPKIKRGRVEFADLTKYSKEYGMVVPDNLICRYVEIPPNTIMKSHRHSAKEAGLLIFIEGSGTFVQDGERFKISKGAMIGRIFQYCKGAKHHLESGPQGLSYLSMSTGADISNDRLNEI